MTKYFHLWTGFGRVVCPFCGGYYAKSHMKRHLVKKHNWRYTDDSPNEPTPNQEP